MIYFYKMGNVNSQEIEANMKRNEGISLLGII